VYIESVLFITIFFLFQSDLYIFFAHVKPLIVWLSPRPQQIKKLSYGTYGSTNIYVHLTV
jgi:hypothetical protein